MRQTPPAMKAKMENTFGDLSALRDYQPPVREAAPAQAGPYTGPVTHAVSNASPSPMAAGVMQARRGKKPRREKIAGSTNDAMDANGGDSLDNEEWDRRKRERAKDWGFYKKNLSPGGFTTCWRVSCSTHRGLTGMQTFR